MDKDLKLLGEPGSLLARIPALTISSIPANTDVSASGSWLFEPRLITPGRLEVYGCSGRVQMENVLFPSSADP